MLSSGKNPIAVQMSLIRKFSLIILLSLSMLLVAGALAGKAEAVQQKSDVGNIDVYYDTLDNRIWFELSYDLNAPPNPNFYGNSFSIYGLNYGGYIGNMRGWNVDSIVTNANGSKDYHLKSMASLFNIQPNQNVTFSLYFAPQNGSPVPQGLGGMSLDSSLNVQSGYGAGDAYTGSIGVPTPLATGPTVVPEPLSSILFLSGAGVLAGRRYLKKQRTN